MTDDEREKLVAELREDAPDWTTSGQRVRMLCDEIEWLSKRLEAAHGYASECEDRIKMLNDQIDAMLSAQGAK